MRTRLGVQIGGAPALVSRRRPHPVLAALSRRSPGLPACKIRAIKERLSQLGWLVGYAPSSWSKSDRMRWSKTLAALKGLCEP